MSGTRCIWQFYYIQCCVAPLNFEDLLIDWHPLFQIHNSSPDDKMRFQNVFTFFVKARTEKGKNCQRVWTKIVPFLPGRPTQIKLVFQELLHFRVTAWLLCRSSTVVTDLSWEPLNVGKSQK